MLRFLWERGVTINFIATTDLSNVITIERSLRKELSAAIISYLPDQNFIDLDCCVGDDFIATNEAGDVFEDFIDAEEDVYINFPFEVYIENKEIFDLDMITQNYIHYVVKGIEAALDTAVGTVFGESLCEVKYVFNKVYLE